MTAPVPYLARFLAPHLRPGSALLDCGSGDGALTIGLAGMVAPGQVTGIDADSRQVERARALAAQRQVPGVRFDVGDVRNLVFRDASFDAAWCSFTLEHLPDPLQALRELRRVLKSGGVLGILDYDYGVRVMAPQNALLEESRELYVRHRLHEGSSPLYAHDQRQLLLEAGFARTEGFAFSPCWGGADATRGFAGVQVQMWQEPTVGGEIVRRGWVDQAKADAMIAEWKAWGERREAFAVALTCAAIGWV